MDSETLNGISLSGIINQFINIPHQVSRSFLALSLPQTKLPLDHLKPDTVYKGGFQKKKVGNFP